MIPDLIVVPGGGVRAGGLLPPWMTARFDRALELRAGQPLLCLSAGTPHKPGPVDLAGYPVSEAGAGARYLMERGVAPGDILIEAASFDTIGNAYFARLVHTEPRGWRRLLIVTSEFHRERTEAVFRWVFSIAPEAGYELAFESTPDVGMPAADLEFRRARERESLAAARGLLARIPSLAELHRFLFTGHDAYSAAGLLKDRERSAALDRVY